MKKRFLLGLLVVCSVFSIHAQSVLTAWIEGQVQLRSGTTWTDIDIGDDLSPNAVVRLGKASFAEFNTNNNTITLSSEGVYDLSTLIAASEEQAGKRAAVVAKMSRIVNRQTPRSTVVAGVRGSFEGAPEKTEWALEDDDPELLAEDAKQFITNEKYLEAADLFGRAAEESIGEVRDEYQYSQAWSYAAAGKTIDAIKTLRSMQVQGYFEVPRAILLARLNLDTGAIQEALNVLESVEDNPALIGEEIQLVKELKQEALASL